MRKQLRVEPSRRASLVAVKTGDLREDSQVVIRKMHDN